MQDLVKFLPYLLPLETPVEDDQNLALVSLYFRGTYADHILQILHIAEIIPTDVSVITNDDMPDVINRIEKLFSLSANYCFVDNKNDTVQIFTGSKMKSNRLKIERKMLKLAQNGDKEFAKIHPQDIMTEKKQEPGFANKCIAGILFKDLLLLFESILKNLENTSNNVAYNVAVFFNSLTRAKSLNYRLNAFSNRQKYKKGADKTADAKNAIRARYEKIIYDMGIQQKDTLPQNISETIKIVREEYCRQHQRKKSPLTSKTLEGVLISAPKRKFLAS
ncbi:MAG: hypothetical protein ACLRFN_01205 [Alphaproteobacteria bacterium]